ncbi:MAG: Na+/H+ antiporter NhaC family protein [Proteobacteria bacterium]|nr:Na+/H+ antiporter NhaC family protein [Pseudomonadota bacterium]MCP4918593.1 Na+/H+ antiporter NhaC family protein [Pseudomonadota bacterium]
MDPSILSLLPALIAVVLALSTRNVMLSLFSAVWLAGTMVNGWNPIAGLYHAVDPYLLDSAASRDNMKVTLFSLFVGATVGIMSKSGGTRALVDAAVGFAKTRRSAMLATWLSGMLVFFDDYANCLVVGSAMRPLTDRMKVSREKLAYIVDSTAAPIASIALVSTWIGYEVGLMGDGLKAAGMHHIDPYTFFVEGIGYRFYSIFTIFFVGAVAFFGRDFGPMLAAERKAAASVTILPKSDPTQTARPGLWVLAALPIFTLISVTFMHLWVVGSAAALEEGLTDPKLFEIIGGADGYDAMLQGSLAAMIVAIIETAGMRALSMKDTLQAGIDGMTTLFPAIIVLMLAWALGAGMSDLHASDYLIGVLSDSLHPAALPTVVFVVSAAIAFATGTSFGTMGIVVPLVIPLSFALSPHDPMIALAASGAVLSGACWGDHCSPISDTTVLSSIGTECDLAAHVKTQLPYAIACGTISILLGTVPVGLGAPLILVLPLGIAACFLTVRVLGRPVTA